MFKDPLSEKQNAMHCGTSYACNFRPYGDAGGRRIGDKASLNYRASSSLVLATLVPISENQTKPQNLQQLKGCLFKVEIKGRIFTMTISLADSSSGRMCVTGVTKKGAHFKMAHYQVELPE